MVNGLKLERCSGSSLGGLKSWQRCIRSNLVLFSAAETRVRSHLWKLSSVHIFFVSELQLSGGGRNPPRLKPINASDNKVIYWYTKGMSSRRLGAARRSCRQGSNPGWKSLPAWRFRVCGSASSSVGHCEAWKLIGRETAGGHHGAPLAFNPRQTTEQTHWLNNPLPYLSDAKVRRGPSS